MNMQVAHRLFISEADERDKARSLHLKLRLGAPRQAPKALPAPVVEKPRQRLPMWRVVDIQFDHHLGLWKQQLNRWGPPKYMSYIRRRCDEADIPYETIIGQTKHRRVTAIRQEIMFGLRTDFSPPPSYAQIGRLMGNKDLAASVKSDFLIGMTFEAIGKKYNLGHETISRFTKEMGWSRSLKTGYAKPGETPMPVQNRIIELYQQGLPIRDIACQCGVGIRTVSQVRRRMGIKVRAK